MRVKKLIYNKKYEYVDSEVRATVIYHSEKNVYPKFNKVKNWYEFSISTIHYSNLGPERENDILISISLTEDTVETDIFEEDKIIVKIEDLC